ncbi:MAG: general stress protein CsbD [Cyclobacteriaceae bacterium]
MNILRSWREQKAMLRQRFSNLTDDDFKFEIGEKDTMLEKLSAKLNKTRAELDILFAELQKY